MFQFTNSAPIFVLDHVTAGYTRESAVFEDFTLTRTGPGLSRIRGKNGTGKSTLVELISGYLRPQRGSVHIGGIPADRPAARAARNICRTALALYPQMSAHDHLVLASRARGTDPADALARWECYGAGDWLDSPAGELSTGNARKLWVILCTLGVGSLVVLDEPFIGLDTHGIEMLRSEIDAWSITSRVLLIAHGDGAEESSAEDIVLGTAQ